jgi:acyl transferase domain-containing protein
MFKRAGMLAPDGRCKSLDSSADGYVRGEACASAMLHLLSDASDQGSALACILGSAVNQDGRSSSLTAPNGPAQQGVIRQALRGSGVVPNDVATLQMHGTGKMLA